MSGWLGAVNYGVIVANEVDSFLLSDGRRGDAGGNHLPRGTRTTISSH